jgi:hypothetical protein
VTCFETCSIPIHTFIKPDARRVRRQWTRDTESTNIRSGTGSCAGSNTRADAGANTGSHSGTGSGAYAITCACSIHGAYRSSRAEA